MKNRGCEKTAVKKEEDLKSERATNPLFEL